MERSLNVEAASQVAICNVFQHRVDIVGRMAGNHAPCRQNGLVSDISHDLVSDINHDLVSDINHDLVSDINHDLVSDINDDLVSDILVNHDDRGQNRLVSDIHQWQSISICIITRNVPLTGYVSFKTLNRMKTRTNGCHQ